MTSNGKKTSAIWGGRFESGPDAVMDAINVSIDTDKRMYRQDIAGSRAHCRMLGKQGIIPQGDADAILNGLDQIEAEMDAGTFEFKRAYEDIHMNVEARLTEIIGPVAGRLHTARSRNDQVATGFRLWVRDAVDGLIGQIDTAIAALQGQADKNKTTIMPGFTHLQVAQPVTLALHLDAYVQMLSRDRARFVDARKRVNESPLGSAALAGTSYPIDRAMTAKDMGFDRPLSNTMDGVSSRDFALEVMAAISICGTHLSRLAEEIVLWSTPQFGFIRISDGFSSGSSIMPQKRNPDAAELSRAKVGRIAGAFQSLVMVMKGLPLAYSKDMQEDKEVTFDAIASLKLALAAMAGMVGDLEPVPERMRAAAGRGFSTATDLADWLVRELKMPFRDAHHVTGTIVKLAETQGCDLEALPLEAMQRVEPRITQDIYSVLSVENSVKSRTSHGGTAPQNVLKMAQGWLACLELGSKTG